MKKVLSILLSLLLLLSLFGCSAPAEVPETTEPFVWYHSGAVDVSEQTLLDAAKAEYVQPKNIILMIGDGMGLNDLENARRFAGGKFPYGLAMDYLPNRGAVTTFSNDNAVTDSAASATALATGFKTNNGRLGLDPDGHELKNISELAREKGKKIGVVTNDDMTGATPCGFLVHNSSREDTVGLWDSLVAAAPDLLIGNGDYAMREVGLSTESLAAMDGYIMSRDFASFTSDLDSDADKPFYGFLATNLNSADNFLAYCTEIALNRLENENGFFLMVEGCGTDKAGHKNLIDGKLNSVITFDRAVAVAMAYCLKHPDTVLIVTADHETGGVIVPEAADSTKKDILFTTEEHTGTEVGIFAMGYGAEQFHQQKIDNTDIAKFMFSLLQ